MGNDNVYDGERIVLSGCLIVNDKKEILLLHKIKFDYYEIPKGKVDLKDCVDPENLNVGDLMQTALREFLEEIKGVTISEPEYFGKTKFTKPNGEIAIAHTFYAKYVSGDAEVGEPNIFSEVKWIPIEKLDEFNLSPDLIEVLPSIKTRLLG